LRGVIGGPAPLLASGIAMLALEPRELLITAVKPAERGDGIVVRVLNPTDAEHTAHMRLGTPIATARAVRLDEEPAQHEVELDGNALRFNVPPRALRSVMFS
jgi:mannosylglycerate hydrolase